MNKRKKTHSIISLILFLLFMAAGTAFLWSFISDFSANPELFKEAVDAYGEGNNAVIFIIMQVLQIIFPILPGEVIEVGAGYVFGPFIGLLLCELGILLASVPVFFISRKFGNRIVGDIFSSDKIKSLLFLKNERRVTLIVFLLFFIPGTPKDLLTYFVGLTPIKPLHFILITLFARIPSILTSTLAGASMGSGQSSQAITIYAITAVISVIGMIVYSIYTKRKASAK